ncbi:hypothetical protein LJR030_002870 [Rhizobium sp. LjRoot30]|uniref:hypothetical protein n=1 Tax=Rhizobium sp. LjRoot30 TaxID=3342320 RepID=UPI003ECF9CC1
MAMKTTIKEMSMRDKSTNRKAPNGPGEFRRHTPISEPEVTNGKDTPISSIVAELFRIMGTDTTTDIGQLPRPGQGLQLVGQALMCGSNVALVFHADGEIEIYYEPMLLAFLEKFEMSSRAQLRGLRAFERTERQRGLDTVILAGRWTPPFTTRRSWMFPYLVGRRFHDEVTYAPFLYNSWCMSEALPFIPQILQLDATPDLEYLVNQTQGVIDAGNFRFEEIDGIPLIEGILWSVISNRHPDGRMIAGFRTMSKHKTLLPELRSKML